MQGIQRLDTTHFSLTNAGNGDFWLKARTPAGKNLMRHKRISTIRGKALVGSERLLAFVRELERKANVLSTL